MVYLTWQHISPYLKSRVLYSADTNALILFCFRHTRMCPCVVFMYVALDMKICNLNARMHLWMNTQVASCCTKLTCNAQPPLKSFDKHPSSHTSGKTIVDEGDHETSQPILRRAEVVYVCGAMNSRKGKVHLLATCAGELLAYSNHAVPNYIQLVVLYCWSVFQVFLFVIFWLYHTIPHNCICFREVILSNTNTIYALLIHARPYRLHTENLNMRQFWKNGTEHCKLKTD